MGQGGDLVSWELISAQAARRCSRAPCLEKWVLGTGTGSEDPLGPRQVGMGSLSPGSLHQCHGPLLTPAKRGKDTLSTPLRLCLGLWLEHFLGVHGPGGE